MPSLQADLVAHCMRLEQENEKLKSEIAMLCKSLEHFTSLYFPTTDRKIASDAISATASSDAWLKEQKAKVLEDAAMTAISVGQRVNHYGIADELRRMAAELRSTGNKT